MGQNPHLLRKWGDGPGDPAQREHLLDGDSPGPELVPGQRSFLKANSTLLHPYHVHPGGARLCRAPLTPRGWHHLTAAQPGPSAAELVTLWLVPSDRVHTLWIPGGKRPHSPSRLQAAEGQLASREAAAKGKGLKLGSHRDGARTLVREPRLRWQQALSTTYPALPGCPQLPPAMAATGLSPPRASPNYCMTQAVLPKVAVRQADRKRGFQGQRATPVTRGTSQSHDCAEGQRVPTRGSVDVQHPKHSSPGRAHPGDALWDPRCETCLTTVRSPGAGQRAGSPLRPRSSPTAHRPPPPPILRRGWSRRGHAHAHRWVDAASAWGLPRLSLGWVWQGQVLNRDPQTDCNPAFQTSSSACWEFIAL